MLVFIGIAIVALIVIQIVFHIVLAIGLAVTEGDGDSSRIKRILDSTMAEDEMDRMINLRCRPCRVRLRRHRIRRRAT